eukprot:COSAG04_NODE_1942_length_5168_cov_15.124877_3_plen_208_part_00
MHSPLNREGSHAQASYSTPVYMHMRSNSAGSVSPPRAAARTPVRTAQPPPCNVCPSRCALIPPRVSFAQERAPAPPSPVSVSRQLISEQARTLSHSSGRTSPTTLVPALARGSPRASASPRPSPYATGGTCVPFVSSNSWLRLSASANVVGVSAGATRHERRRSLRATRPSWRSTPPTLSTPTAGCSSCWRGNRTRGSPLAPRALRR